MILIQVQLIKLEFTMLRWKALNQAKAVKANLILVFSSSNPLEVVLMRYLTLILLICTLGVH